MNEQLINEFTSIQEQLRSRIELQNNFSIDQLSLVAGVDLAYWKDEKDQDHAVCCIVVIDYHTKQVVEEESHYGLIDVPYVSGFLAFRELPLVLETVDKLQNCPDLYMFDGNGYLHYRHMGIATHAAFHLNKPTIGVAKEYLKIKNTDFIMPDMDEAAFTDIVIDNEVYGRALRTRKGVKPIFVSCGNWIDLSTAAQITLLFIEKNSRLPITTRLADLNTHRVRKEMLGKLL